jgi:hypothetical protein
MVLIFLKSKYFNLLLLCIISLYSFLINFYYSNLGTFPIDTFLHFDSSYRILNKEYPVKDFWVVSGFIVDFIQSIFFKIIGINWHAYILHSSVFNTIASIFTYYFISSLGVSKFYSFIYTLCFATLAYTVSGTPFVDHHASIFLLIGTYLLAFVIRSTDKNYLWPFVIILYSLSFLSKQVPVSYAILTQGSLVFFILLKDRSLKALAIIFLSSISVLSLFIFFLFTLGIEYKLFYTQYLEYPSSIGSDRITSNNTSFKNIISEFKYLIFPIFIIFFLKIKKKQFKLSKETIILLIFLALGVSLVYHQTLTKNQIYIYFLIPLFFAILHSEILKNKLRFKKYYLGFILIFLIFVTIKYHFRFNENRKFHELNSKLISKAINANQIDPIFQNLQWINPTYKGTAEEEIKTLIEAKIKLDNEKGELMLISHYLFFDAITKKKMNYPNRTFTSDGASFPGNKSKLKNFYKSYLLKTIKEKKINKIYFFKNENISNAIITNNISNKCLMLENDNIFYIYKIICLD